MNYLAAKICEAWERPVDRYHGPTLLISPAFCFVGREKGVRLLGACSGRNAKSKYDVGNRSTVVLFVHKRTSVVTGTPPPVVFR